MNSRSIQTVTLGIALLAAGCAKLQPNAENQLQTDSAQVDSAPVILGTVATPVFSPGAGVYAATQNVSLTSTTTGTTICYATNPVQPLCNATKTGCATGTVYSATITVSTTQIINAIGCKANHDDSTIASASYTIDTAAPSVPTGFGGTPISTSQINLNWTASTDAVTPQANLTYEICRTTTSGGCSTFAITHTSSTGATAYSATGLAANTTYYFVLRAKDALGNASAGTAQVTATTTAAGTVNTPTFSPAAGTYGATQNVAISSTTGSATICYTTTGTTPACDAPKTGCTTGTLYASSVSISSSQTLRAIGCRPGFTDSAVNAGAFVIDTTPPGNVTAFAATSGNGQISLSWTNPGAADFAGVKILRKTGSYPANSTDGTTVYNDTGASHTDTGLTNGTQYYYKAFAYDTVGNYASGSQVSQTPVQLNAAVFARSITAGVDDTMFAAVTADEFGNSYAVGYQTGTSQYSYGSGVSASSGGSAGTKSVLVKYNSAGTPLWAVAATGGSNSSFKGVAIDSTGNVYAAGYQTGSSSYTYGAGISVSGAYSSGTNSVLVKYNSSGSALWAKTVSGVGQGSSRYNGVTVDGVGNVITVGSQNGDGLYNYGNGISASGSAFMPSNTPNAVIVSYDSTGVAQWASSVSSGTGASAFVAVATYGGFAYAAGYQHGSGSYTYSGVTTSGASNSLGNALIVKFSITTGAGQWARSTSNGSSSSDFSGIATDTSGNIYACGHQSGNVPYTYGSGVTATAPWNYNNFVLVKYNATGTAQWARTVNAASSDSWGYATATDAWGNVFAVGYQNDKGNFDFGNGVTVSGASSFGNALILKYNPQGNAVQAQTISTGGNSSIFRGLNIRGAHISAVGYQTGNGVYTYGAIAAATGSAVGTNSVLVRYE